MVTTEKKINLEVKKTYVEERKIELAIASEDSKMLTMRMDELNVAMIMCVVHLRLLECLVAKMEATKKEAACEDRADKKEAEAESARG